jgi:hypothetical protein
MKTTRDNGKPVEPRFLTYHASSAAILEPGWELEFDAIFEGWARHGRLMQTIEEETND